MAQQAAFDAAWMNPDAEAFLDQLHQIRQPNGWFFLAHLADECEGTSSVSLCACFGPRLCGTQASQSVLFESG